MKIKKFKYLDCKNDPALYLQWIIQEFGASLLEWHGNYCYSGHLHHTGMAHVYELVRQTGRPIEEVLYFIQCDVRKNVYHEQPLSVVDCYLKAQLCARSFSQNAGAWA